jgi:hypothetical protein
MSEEAKGDAGIDGDVTAAHIIKWTEIMGKGPHAFEQALNKERRRLTRNPVVFAVMEPHSNTVQLAHGFKDMALDDEGHEATETVGFFLGDRVNVVIDNVATQHDPPFWTVDNFTKLTTKFHGKTAMAAACTKAGVALIPGDAKARMVDVPKMLQVPKLWWSFFLGRAPTASETHRWVTGVTRAWTSDTKKAAALITRQWTRAACTQSTASVSSSALALAVRPGPRDAPSVQWATYSLNSYLPRPKQSPRTQEPAAAANNMEATAHNATLHQAMVLAQDVIRSAVE